MDVVDTATRSKMMAGIGSKNTKPEMIVRKELFRRGFRYRLHDGNLPGKPDLVLPKYQTVIFVNGCFWHGHKCQLFKWPKSNVEFWKTKINNTVIRDMANLDKCSNMGWKVITIWECSLRSKSSVQINKEFDKISSVLKAVN